MATSSDDDNDEDIDIPSAQQSQQQQRPFQWTTSTSSLNSNNNITSTISQSQQPIIPTTSSSLSNPHSQSISHAIESALNNDQAEDNDDDDTSSSSSLTSWQQLSFEQVNDDVSVTHDNTNTSGRQEPSNRHSDTEEDEDYLPSFQRNIGVGSSDFGNGIGQVGERRTSIKRSSSDGDDDVDVEVDMTNNNGNEMTSKRRKVDANMLNGDQQRTSAKKIHQPNHDLDLFGSGQGGGVDSDEDNIHIPSAQQSWQRHATTQLMDDDVVMDQYDSTSDDDRITSGQLPRQPQRHATPPSSQLGSRQQHEHLEVVEEEEQQDEDNVLSEGQDTDIDEYIQPVSKSIPRPGQSVHPASSSKTQSRPGQQLESRPLQRPESPQPTQKASTKVGKSTTTTAKPKSSSQSKSKEATPAPTTTTKPRSRAQSKSKDSTPTPTTTTDSNSPSNVFETSKPKPKPKPKPRSKSTTTSTSKSKSNSPTDTTTTTDAFISNPNIIIAQTKTKSKKLPGKTPTTCFRCKKLSQEGLPHLTNCSDNPPCLLCKESGSPCFVVPKSNVKQGYGKPEGDYPVLVPNGVRFFRNPIRRVEKGVGGRKWRGTRRGKGRGNGKGRKRKNGGGGDSGSDGDGEDMEDDEDEEEDLDEDLDDDDDDEISNGTSGTTSRGTTSTTTSGTNSSRSRTVSATSSKSGSGTRTPPSVITSEQPPTTKATKSPYIYDPRAIYRGHKFGDENILGYEMIRMSSEKTVSDVGYSKVMRLLGKHFGCVPGAIRWGLEGCQGVDVLRDWVREGERRRVAGSTGGAGEEKTGNADGGGERSGGGDKAGGGNVGGVNSTAVNAGARDSGNADAGGEGSGSSVNQGSGVNGGAVDSTAVNAGAGDSGNADGGGGGSSGVDIGSKAVVVVANVNNRGGDDGRGLSSEYFKSPADVEPWEDPNLKRWTEMIKKQHRRPQATQGQPKILKQSSRHIKNSHSHILTTEDKIHLIQKSSKYQASTTEDNIYTLTVSNLKKLPLASEFVDSSDDEDDDDELYKGYFQKLEYKYDGRDENVLKRVEINRRVRDRIWMKMYEEELGQAYNYVPDVLLRKRGWVPEGWRSRLTEMFGIDGKSDDDDDEASEGESNGDEGRQLKGKKPKTNPWETVKGLSKTDDPDSILQRPVPDSLKLIPYRVIIKQKKNGEEVATRERRSYTERYLERFELWKKKRYERRRLFLYGVRRKLVGRKNKATKDALKEGGGGIGGRVEGVAYHLLVRRVGYELTQDSSFKPGNDKKKGWFIPFSYVHINVTDIFGNNTASVVKRGDLHGTQFSPYVLNTKSLLLLPNATKTILPDRNRGGNGGRDETKNPLPGNPEEGTPKEPSDVILLANPSRAGFYRFLPHEDDMIAFTNLFARLATKPNVSILTNETNPTLDSILQPPDRGGLVSDTVALVLSNRMHPGVGLPLLSNLLRLDTHPTVWRVAVESLLGRMESAMKLYHGYPIFRKWIQGLVFDVLDKVGIFSQGENLSVQNVTSMKMDQLRGILLPIAARLGHEPTITYARNVYARLLNESKPRVSILAKNQTTKEPWVPRYPWLSISYDVAIRDDPFRNVAVLFDDKVLLPGDRVGAVARTSRESSHLVMVLSLMKEKKKKSGGRRRVPISAEWLQRVQTVANGDAGLLGSQMAWEALRRGVDGEGDARVDDDRDEQGDNGDGIRANAPGKNDPIEVISVWDELVRDWGTKKLAIQTVEIVIAASEWNGSVVREALGLVGGETKWKEKQDENVVESGLLTAVRRGLERSEADFLFRTVWGDEVERVVNGLVV
ncbi:hypothetical protein HDU76_007361 [Blyttiomyces sp. JEL0837]|nr:hypothetical protein HDU76_007361 [Blyttiomyces sp. JEL0837]